MLVSGVESFWIFYDKTECYERETFGLSSENDIAIEGESPRTFQD